MTTPIGDGKGSLGGCRLFLFLALLSTLLVLVVVAVGVVGLRAAIRSEHPKPASSTSTRSTP